MTKRLPCQVAREILERVDAEAKRTIERMREARAADGPSYGDSALADVTPYTLPAEPTGRCDTCNRGPRFQEGCSHVDCPHRRTLTANWHEWPARRHRGF